MGRTKMEIDALTSKIMEVIQERQISREKQFTPEATKQFKTKLKPLLVQKEALDRKIATELKKLGIADYPHIEHDESVIAYLASKLAKNKEVDVDVVERDVILSGDQGADVLIKKISEMYL